MPQSNARLCLQKDFISEVEKISSAYNPRDVFSDLIRVMAIDIHNPMFRIYSSSQKERYEGYEKEYKRIFDKYGEHGRGHLLKACSLVIEALEKDREDFLGTCLEHIGAANKNTQQFLTPTPVARVMASVCNGDVSDEYKRVQELGGSQIVTLNDPACGAGVTLIEGAEELMKNGVEQRDILILAQDLDFNAFNTCYVQLSLLGYAAVITRMDSLSMQVFDGPWYTPGLFAHGMPMRQALRRLKNGTLTILPDGATEDLPKDEEPVVSEDQKLVQPTSSPPATDQLTFDF